MPPRAMPSRSAKSRSNAPGALALGRKNYVIRGPAPRASRGIDCRMTKSGCSRSTRMSRPLRHGSAPAMNTNWKNRTILPIGKWPPAPRSNTAVTTTRIQEVATITTTMAGHPDILARIWATVRRDRRLPCRPILRSHRIRISPPTRRPARPFQVGIGPTRQTMVVVAIGPIRLMRRRLPRVARASRRRAVHSIRHHPPTDRLPRLRKHAKELFANGTSQFKTCTMHSA